MATSTEEADALLEQYVGAALEALTNQIAASQQSRKTFAESQKYGLTDSRVHRQELALRRVIWVLWEDHRTQHPPDSRHVLLLFAKAFQRNAIQGWRHCMVAHHHQDSWELQTPSSTLQIPEVMVEALPVELSIGSTNIMHCCFETHLNAVLRAYHMCCYSYNTSQPLILGGHCGHAYEHCWMALTICCQRLRAACQDQADDMRRRIALVQGRAAPPLRNTSIYAAVRREYDDLEELEEQEAVPFLHYQPRTKVDNKNNLKSRENIGEL